MKEEIEMGTKWPKYIIVGCNSEEVKALLLDKMRLTSTEVHFINKDDELTIIPVGARPQSVDMVLTPPEICFEQICAVDKIDNVPFWRNLPYKKKR